MRVGADAAVREGEWCTVNLFDADNGGEVLQVDLVDDARSRGNDAELVEGTLRPAQQLVALGVALVLLRHVLLERFTCCPAINLYGVVDHQVGGDLRIDAMRINAEFGCRVAESGKVNDGGHAGEVLQHNAGRGEGDLALIAGRRCGSTRFPCEIGVQVFWLHEAIARAAGRTLNKDLQYERELGPWGCRLWEELEGNAVRETRAERAPRRKVVSHRASSLLCVAATAAPRVRLG